MVIFTVVSPDKLSQSMFVDFYKTENNGKDIVILDINSLYSPEIKNSTLDGAIKHIQGKGTEDNSTVLIKYKVKKNDSTDLSLTDMFLKSDFVIRFELYSTQFSVLKATDKGSMETIASSWKKFVEVCK